MKTEAQKQVEKNVSGAKFKGDPKPDDAQTEGGAGAVSSITLKKHKDAIFKAMKAAADANAGVKSAWSAAKKDGIDKDAFKETLEAIRATTNTDDHKATVNIYMEMLGHGPLFHFAAETTKH